ncbi:F-box/WD repeat-containing protein 7 [Chelonia mydas]|uniref:F-box/WD repeat-containing protein 7 n=1 Tax=Chelonia mydas TaxID=8469 RepID=M7AIP9_CHEMY|nr:F-box/WD repeat-containing protein 7 [Chelonia mydas]
MNQELLSVGSKRRRTGASLRGNASSSQVDEEQMNRVVEEEQQQQQLQQQEEEHIARNGEIGGAESGLGDRIESQQEQLEENNNRLIAVDEESTGNQEEEEEEEEHGAEQEEEVEEEEEMDQESDDFDQSDDSSREDEHTNSNSVTNSNSIMDLPIHQSSQFYIKTKYSTMLAVTALLAVLNSAALQACIPPMEGLDSETCPMGTLPKAPCTQLHSGIATHSALLSVLVQELNALSDGFIL